MAFKISTLWKAPKVNRINHKARTIPILNPFDPYGRVFFFACFGYFISFWSWYAFPPLTTITIKEDLHLSQADVANANIVANASAVLVRVVAGFACDRYGPRVTFAALMLAGAIPTGLAGTVTNATGFLVLRCFTGILAGGLVPCEVWCMGFFDKNVVGTANALAAGWANMGSGLTYYAMPAIFDSLVKHRGLTPHAAWRVSFIIPTILVISVAILMLVFGEDSPTGPWSERQRALNQQLRTRDLFVSTVKRRQGSDPRSNACSDDKIELNASEQTTDDIENPVKDEQDLITAMSWELVQKPSVTQSARAVFSIHAFVLFSMYFCSLGIELTLVSILGAYYYEKFPPLGQTLSGDWASMFGFLDLVSRPAGGIISDAFFRSTGSLWSRKMWFHFLLLVAGVFACVIGFTSPDSKANLFGLMVGLAFFAEAGNGAVFALVPHVYPASNGVISGFTAAAGCLGTVAFQLIARYNGANYSKTVWIIGVWVISTQVLTCFIPPISKRQLGGR